MLASLRGIPSLVHPPWYTHLVYTPVYTHPVHRPCTQRAVPTSTSDAGVKVNVSYSREGERERPLCALGRPFSLLRITSFPAETGLKRQRNPLQRVIVHKEPLNMPTPPEVSSRPPQG